MKETIKESTNQLASMLTIAVLASLLLGWAIQFLWNSCLVPAVNNINEIGYWQAVGLFFLFNLLLKSGNVKSSK
jgi:hypothetical protein